MTSEDDQFDLLPCTISYLVLLSKSSVHTQILPCPLGTHGKSLTLYNTPTNKHTHLSISTCLKVFVNGYFALARSEIIHKVNFSVKLLSKSLIIFGNEQGEMIKGKDERGRLNRW